MWQLKAGRIDAIANIKCFTDDDKKLKIET